MSEAQGKMEIEKRQMSERNKLARYCGTIAAIAIAFFAIRALAFNGVNPLDTVRLVVAIVDIILLQVGAIIYGEKYIYK